MSYLLFYFQVEEPNKSKDQIFSEVSSAALSDSLRKTTNNNLPEKHSNSTKCQNCNVNAWKYKCPKCNFHSCSLKCCKSHKEKYSCEGIRSKVKYVPLEQYGYENLMSGKCYVLISSLLSLTNRN